MTKSLRIKKVNANRRSTDSIALRLHKDTGAAFRKLARDMGIGPSTLARAVLEEYVATYGASTRRKKRG